MECALAKSVAPTVLLTLSLLLNGCGELTPEARLAVGAVTGVTIAGSRTPTTDIEQTYYLGTFDPQDQLPPQFYRIRVRGQASAISSTKFASGWVPAALVDSLGSRISLGDGGQTEINSGAQDQLSALKTGRRLVMFGPEGFREAPAEHRLVVVMGSDPQAFFQAIDQTLGAVAEQLDRERGSELQGELFEALLRLKEERGRLRDLEADLRVDQADARREVVR